MPSKVTFVADADVTLHGSPLSVTSTCPSAPTRSVPWIVMNEKASTSTLVICGNAGLSSADDVVDDASVDGIAQPALTATRERTAKNTWLQAIPCDTGPHAPSH